MTHCGLSCNIGNRPWLVTHPLLPFCHTSSLLGNRVLKSVRYQPCTLFVKPFSFCLFVIDSLRECFVGGVIHLLSHCPVELGQQYKLLYYLCSNYTFFRLFNSGAFLLHGASLSVEAGSINWGATASWQRRKMLGKPTMTNPTLAHLLCDHVPSEVGNHMFWKPTRFSPLS